MQGSMTFTATSVPRIRELARRLGNTRPFKRVVTVKLVHPHNEDQECSIEIIMTGIERLDGFESDVLVEGRLVGIPLLFPSGIQPEVQSIVRFRLSPKRKAIPLYILPPALARNRS